MALLHPQLEAFLAVIEEGGFERAAGRLCITPSALSQRIKGLEDRLGAVLVRRSVPAVATPAGEKLLRRAQSMRLLESETLADFRPGEETDRVARITILVNNDSLATWLPEALTDFALHAGSSEKGRQRVALDVRTDDQDHALESLRNGTAVAVVTSESAPVLGARATALGAMRYVAVASPDFAETFLRGDPNETLRNAPVLCFDRKDSLQERFLAGFGIGPVERPGVVHYAPSPAAMIELTVRGSAGAWRPIYWLNPSSEPGSSSNSCPGARSTFRFSGSVRPSARRFSCVSATSYGKRPRKDCGRLCSEQMEFRRGQSCGAFSSRVSM